MAIYDHEAAREYKNKQEAFEKFQQFMNSKDNTITLDWADKYYLGKYFDDLKNDAEERDKELSEYRTFFGMMSKFLPRQSSIHDVLY